VHMRMRRWVRAIAVTATACAVLSGCATVVNGSPTVGDAPNATLAVKGDSGGPFDTIVKNALSDVIDFWKVQYPKVSGGKPLPLLKGGLYSVDGLQVAQTHHAPTEAANEGCIARNPSFIIDNGAFCLLDDSIAWDRAPTHLFAQLEKKYGPLVVALVFAHEFGHAITYRLGIFDQPGLKTIDTESQADCAAGAWAASALKGGAAHFRDVTAQSLDDALEGFLDGRDSTPGTIDEISHGNGFDRLSALADGIDKGPSFCYSPDYFNRTFTERVFSTEADYNAGGNQPLADTIAPDGLLVKDLNRFWTKAAKSINKTFQPVKIVEAAHPKCGASSAASEFGYCPDDNSVYFSATFAKEAYNSLPGVTGDPSTGNITLLDNQPADFALGTLFAIGWGLAVRHQLFNRSMVDAAGLTSAICYTGSYGKDTNLADDPSQSRFLLLSPADLDEAVSAMLNLVGSDRAFGARGTTGLDRIQSFVKGYKGGLSAC
jgi:predicted metalloprotease